MKMVNITRKDFLDLLWKGGLSLSALLGLAGISRFFAFSPDPVPPSRYDLGSADQYPPGSRTTIKDARAILANTVSGLQALSLTCPHLGCELEATADGFACPCHGSRFTADGKLQHGPASRNMDTLLVEVTDEGKVTLYRKQSEKQVSGKP